MKTKIQL